MSRTAGILPRGPFSGESGFNSHRHVPILPSTTTPKPFQSSDPMDITPPASASMPPPGTSSPEMDQVTPKGSATTNGNAKTRARENGLQVTMTPPPTGNTGNQANAAAAAAASQTPQPKVLQTAFIHKLYNMLEDQSIRHLISWSSSNDSFVMSPSADFSKVLSQYFKHTNISSFVRQLNMYGFHKVSDVFHTGAPDSALWEFKHGNGNFKRGDLAGLREIKRRASRHALIQRDSFSTAPHKPGGSQPGVSAESILEAGDHRLAHLEHNLYEMHARLMRTEENNSVLSSRCAMLSDSLARCHQANDELAQAVLRMIPDRDSQLFRDVSGLQREMARQSEVLAGYTDPHEALLSGRQPYFSAMNLNPENPSVSPNQLAIDDRRPSMHTSQTTPHRPSLFRPSVAPHLAPSPRRYGSIGIGPPGLPAPQHRPPIPTVQYAQPGMPTSHSPHPLSAVCETGLPAHLGRRHTSADIRDTPGWPPNACSPFDDHGALAPAQGGTPSGAWPSPPSAADQHVRDSLASYEFGATRRRAQSRTASPAPPGESSAPAPGGPFAGGEGGWNFNNGGSKYPSRLLDPGSAGSAPATRRSSMASNVHNLLNPADTAGREDEVESGEERKRKRERVS